MSGKQIHICVSAASRELTRNFLTALPKESEGVSSALSEESKLFVVGTCQHDNRCHLMKIKAGGKCDRNPNQCQSFKFYQRCARKGHS